MMPGKRDGKREVRSNVRSGREVNKSSSDSISLIQTMIHALHEDKGLRELSGILAEFLHCGTGVLDMSGELMAEYYCGSCTPEQTELLRKHIVSQRGSELLNIYQLSASLVYGDKSAGILSVARLNTPFTESDKGIIAQTTGLFCVRLSQEKKLAEIELRLKGNFVEDLVFARYSNPESIIGRARALNYNIMVPHRVLIVTIENIKQLEVHIGNDPLSVKADILKMIQSCINQSGKGMVIVSKDEFVLIVQQNKADNDIKDIKAMAEKLVADAEALLKAKMYVGIGSLCNKLFDFSESYHTAKRALEIGEYMITEGRVRSFNQFRIHALFLSTLKPKELYDYAREQLEALLIYDREHGTELLKTMQEFLYLRNNVEGTARAINMSVSGLKYRLKKIEKILGIDLSDYKICFDLQLAFIILQLFGEYK